MTTAALAASLAGLATLANSFAGLATLANSFAGLAAHCAFSHLIV